MAATSPSGHWRQARQEPEYQPRPTVSPTATRVTPSPTAAIVPTTPEPVASTPSAARSDPAVADLETDVAVLDKIYPEGVYIPEFLVGRNIVQLPTVKTHCPTRTSLRSAKAATRRL